MLLGNIYSPAQQLCANINDLYSSAMWPISCLLTPCLVGSLNATRRGEAEPMPEFEEPDTFAALEKREWADAGVAQSYARVFAKAADNRLNVRRDSLSP